MADVHDVYLVFLLMSCISGSNGITLPGIQNRSFISKCVQEHNKARANVKPPASNMRYMTWDEELAVVARAWAGKCLFEHNDQLSVKGSLHPVFPNVGENIWVGTGIFTVASAFKGWVDEVQHYSYDTLTCTDVCGHYTQVVWADSYKVGCAVIDCPGGVRKTTFSHRRGIIFVCNYGPRGNYKGKRPYKEGRACSLCGGESCENNLCRNSTRDHIKSWDVSLERSGVFCTAVLIIRPVSLILILISVWTVQQHCPNLFAYIN